MKKVFVILIIVIPIVFVGSFLYSRFNPPLAVSGGYAYQEDKEVMIVDVGNKYPFGSIKITELLVNNQNQPSKAKMQVSTHSLGFIISDQFNSEEAAEYQFESIENVKLKPNTDPRGQLDKVNEGTISNEDLIYAVTLGHERSIEKVIIKYSYLGVPYEKIVSTTVGEIE
ncbi:hypothetical protein [Salimicrobium flavidum]|uniref:Uncharacterized protein n=1 Tax=Salimicrobium flavidum TaxID=570947 RepID=A0A1N7KSD4_9BACI|nr:hypothetical protein [Salimicrobium flavidum]SIS64455.1 hypothetical protein SAMN05421687_11715 [Salimicrobium flavidum]